MKYAHSDVHCVLDHVGAKIAKMRLNDMQPPTLTTEVDQNKLSADSVNQQQQALVSEAPCQVTYTYTMYPTCEPSAVGEMPDIVPQPIPQVEQQQQPSSAVKPKLPSRVPPFNDLKRKDIDKIFLYAVTSGHVDMVNLLLNSQKIDVNKYNSSNMNPLLEAVLKGHTEVVRTLIQHGASVHCKESNSHTPLMLACIWGHTDIVPILVEAGASIEDQNDVGHTALMEAASAGHLEIARYLVSKGCNINVHSNEYKETALTLAAYKGHLEMVRFLMSFSDHDQAARAEEIQTALMEASMDGHVEVARLLMDAGAQPNMPPDGFESPLTLAASGGHVELAQLLLKRGANIEEINDEGYTPLMEAAREGRDEIAALLLSQGACVNFITEESRETALSLACCAGHIDVVNLLIKSGADLELGCNTPLMEAAQEGHLDIVNRLLEEGANVNAVNDSLETALTFAAENNHVDIVAALIEEKAILDHGNENERTALMRAAQAGHYEVLELLLEAGADPNLTTLNNEDTALSLACASGQEHIVNILLNKGANLNHRLKDNSNMLIEAAKGGHARIVQLLIEHQNARCGAAIRKRNADKLATNKQTQTKSGNNRKSQSKNESKQKKNANSTSTKNSKLVLSKPIHDVGNKSKYPPFCDVLKVEQTQKKVKELETTSERLDRLYIDLENRESSYADILNCIQKLNDTSLAFKLAEIKGTIRSVASISDQVEWSMFYILFRHIMLPFHNRTIPALSDEVLLSGLLSSISKMLLSGTTTLTLSQHEWLLCVQQIIETFKKQQQYFWNETYLSKSKSLCEYPLVFAKMNNFDVVVPGFVLRFCLNSQKIMQEMNINENRFCKLSQLFMAFDDPLRTVECPLSSIMLKDGIAPGEVCPGGYFCEHIGFNSLNSLEVLKSCSIQPDKIVFGIKNGYVCPIRYMEEEMFYMFRQMANCFHSVRHMIHLLTTKDKLPESVRVHLLLPLFAIIGVYYKHGNKFDVEKAVKEYIASFECFVSDSINDVELSTPFPYTIHNSYDIGLSHPHMDLLDKYLNIGWTMDQLRLSLSSAACSQKSIQEPIESVTVANPAQVPLDISQTQCQSSKVNKQSVPSSASISSIIPEDLVDLNILPLDSSNIEDDLANYQNLVNGEMMFDSKFCFFLEYSLSSCIFCRP